MDPPPMRGTTHRTHEPRILAPAPPPGAHRARPVMTECRPVRDGAAVPTPDGLYRPTAPVKPGRPGHLAHLAQRVGHRRRRSFVTSPRGIIDRSRPHQTQRPSPDPTASTPGGYHKGDHSKRPGRRRPRASCCADLRGQIESVRLSGPFRPLDRSTDPFFRHIQNSILLRRPPTPQPQARLHHPPVKVRPLPLICLHRCPSSSSASRSGPAPDRGTPASWVLY